MPAWMLATARWLTGPTQKTTSPIALDVKIIVEVCHTLLLLTALFRCACYILAEKLSKAVM